MKIIRGFFTPFSLFLALLVLSFPAYASGPAAVYALVDRVDYEPNKTQATKVRVYGFFSLADQSNSTSYLKPVSGYMYLECPNDTTSQQRCRVEWGDIEKLAGNSKICAAFGDRFQTASHAYRVRPQSESPTKPDMYTPRWGLGVQEVEFGVCQDVKNAKQAMNEPTPEPAAEPVPEPAAEPATPESAAEPTTSTEQAKESTTASEPSQTEQPTPDAGPADTTTTESTGQEQQTSNDTATSPDKLPDSPSNDGPGTTDKEIGNTPDTNTQKPTGCSCQADPKEMGLSLVFLFMIVVLLRWRRSSAPQQG